MRKLLSLLALLLCASSFAAPPPPVRISVTTDTSGRLLAPLNFFQSNFDLLSNAVVTLALSQNTNQVWPVAGANTSTFTNANRVTINADVSRAEVNNASNIVSQQNVATSNFFALGSGGSAQAATNGMGLPSGLAAFRPTNSFAPNTVATASAFGLVKPDGVTITISGGVISSIGGGAGNVTGPGSATDGTFPLFNGGSGTVIKASAFSPGSFDLSGAATTASSAVTNALGVPSGLAAFRGTNTLASTNVATASAVGLVKVDNSTILIGSDGTLSSAVGGGNVNGSGSSTSGHLAKMGNTSSTLIQDSGFAPADFDVAGSATAATNAFAIGSGNSANVPTNRFLTAANGSATGTFSIATGNYLKIYFANGAILRTNQAAPFDWEFNNTNGTITTGTNSVTKSTLDRFGNLTLPGVLPPLGASGKISGTQLALSGGINAGSGFIVDNPGNVTATSLTSGGTLNITGLSTLGDFLGTGAFEAQNLGTFDSGVAVTGTAAVTGNATVTGNVIGSGNGTFSGTVQGTSVKVTSATGGTSAVFDGGGNLVSFSNPSGSGTWMYTSDGSGTKTWVLTVDGSALKASQYTATGTTTNLISTLNGNGWTNLTYTTAVLAPAANQTNYTIDFNLADKQYVHSANTNAHFTFSNIGTNRQLDLYVVAITSSVPCNIDFPLHVKHNHYWSLTATNGQEQVYHIEANGGVDPTNVTVFGGDYIHRD